MPAAGWFYRLSEYFRKTFGEKVYKIPLHVGMTCPNRDGSISTKGCVFCCNPAFSPPVAVDEPGGLPADIKEQIYAYQLRMEMINAKRAPGKLEKKIWSEKNSRVNGDQFRPLRKYLAYFQSYTNTYGALPVLDRLYREALSMEGIVGISVATRPDCLSEEVLALLAGYAREYHVWLELGLQSSHNRTLNYINRGHDFACFVDAVERSARRGIMVSAHIINGLPCETTKDMLETVNRINGLPLQGIKLHHLQVMKNTPLAGIYQKEKFRLLSPEEHWQIVGKQLEILRPDIVIHRLMGEAYREELLIAPRWNVFRGTFALMVEKELCARGSYQGKFYAVNNGS